MGGQITRNTFYGKWHLASRDIANYLAVTNAAIIREEDDITELWAWTVGAFVHGKRRRPGSQK